MVGILEGIDVDTKYLEEKINSARTDLEEQLNVIKEEVSDKVISHAKGAELKNHRLAKKELQKG